MPKQFLRRDAKNYSKFGRRRKKLLKWKRPTGRDNKMREKRKGRPKVVSIGYKKDKKIRGLIEGKNTIIVKNIKELEAVKKNQLIIIGAVGKKKKLEIAKKAKEKGIEIHNLNVKNFLKKAEKKIIKTGISGDKKVINDKSKTISEAKPKVKEDRELSNKKITEPSTQGEANKEKLK